MQSKKVESEMICQFVRQIERFILESYKLIRRMILRLVILSVQVKISAASKICDMSDKPERSRMGVRFRVQNQNAPSQLRIPYV